jgi:hypothetical protein
MSHVLVFLMIHGLNAPMGLDFGYRGQSLLDLVGLRGVLCAMLSVCLSVCLSVYFCLSVRLPVGLSYLESIGPGTKLASCTRHRRCSTGIAEHLAMARAGHQGT